jgi:hypothetical protein
VRNEVLHRVDEERYIIHTTRRRKTEGKIEGRVEGREDEEEDLSNYWMTIRKRERVLEIEGGNTRSHSVENWLWKRLWTCCQTDYRC